MLQVLEQVGFPRAEVSRHEHPGGVVRPGVDLVDPDKHRPEPFFRPRLVAPQFDDGLAIRDPVSEGLDRLPGRQFAPAHDRCHVSRPSESLTSDATGLPMFLSRTSSMTLVQSAG